VTLPPPPCFADLPHDHFGAGIADPPWNFATYSARGRGKCADQHYSCMSLEAIAALPVGSWFKRDAALGLWFPQYVAPEIVAEVLRAWGFEFRSLGAWAKRSSTGNHWAFGNGKILRCAAEFYMVGARGHPPIRSHSIRNLIVAPIRKHSHKPDQLHADIEQLYPGPYLELFARRHYPDWTCRGDELPSFPISPTPPRPGAPAEAIASATNTASTLSEEKAGAWCPGL
jgi:N6-adenosine-specific RNA methylase IME4